MKFIKLTLQYLKRNFLYVALVALVPAILLSFFTEPASIMSFFGNFKEFDDLSFYNILKSVSEINWKSVLIGIVVAPIILMFLSAMCGYESKHMRLGILNKGTFFKGVNNNFLTVLKVFVAFLLVLQLYALTFASFAYMWVKIFDSIKVAFIFSMATNLFLLLGMLFIFSIFIIWLPTMSVTGLSLSKALSESFTHVKGNIFKMFVAVIFPLVICFAVVYPLSYYHIRFRSFAYIPIYLFMIMYFITLMYSSYCEIMDIDREDLKNEYGIGGNN